MSRQVTTKRPVASATIAGWSCALVVVVLA
jgi:hypothetical protein